MHPVLVIARLTFKEAARRRILLAALLLGLLFLAIFGIGFFFMMREFSFQTRGSPLNTLQLNAVRNLMLTAGLYVVNFLGIMMTVLTSVDTISGEIGSGTIHTLLAKPVLRWQVLIGKWLGYSLMLSLYLLLMAGGVVTLVYLISGYTASKILLALSMIWLNALLLLSLTLLGGTRLSTLANGVLVFGLFGVAFIGSWIEQIGTFLPDPATKQTAINIGVITSLILPSEALWKRAAYELQSPFTSFLGATPFATSVVPSDLMVGYAFIYLIVILALALREFARRDM